MFQKKIVAAFVCLTLLLVAVVRAEATCAGVGAARFDGPRVVVAASQRRRRRTRRRMKKRTEENRVAEGTWGGNHVRLRVTASGGDIEFDCAHGELSEALKLDAEGRFDVAGTLTREGGPIRLDVPRTGRAARYTGRVEGQTMTLTVKFDDKNQEAQALALTRGSEGRLWKCR
jgi:hypothetical protein